jgi:hypothetical protein
MEITINTTEKTIKVKGTTNIKELIEYLDSIGIDFIDFSIVGTEKEYIYTGGTWPCPCPCPSIPSVPWYTYMDNTGTPTVSTT